MDEDSRNADLLKDAETSEPAIKTTQESIEPEAAPSDSEVTE